MSCKNASFEPAIDDVLIVLLMSITSTIPNGNALPALLSRRAPDTACPSIWSVSESAVRPGTGLPVLSVTVTRADNVDPSVVTPPTVTLPTAWAEAVAVIPNAASAMQAQTNTIRVKAGRGVSSLRAAVCWFIAGPSSLVSERRL